MILRTVIFLVMGAAVLLSGCITLVDDMAIGEQRAGAEVLKTEVYRIKDQVAEMQQKVTRMEEEMSSVQAGRSDELKNTRNRLDELEKKIGSFDAAQQQMKQEIVDDLVKKLEKSGILGGGMSVKSSAKSGSYKQDVKKPVERGYEHVVKQGETLSDISAAYNVAPAVIIKANSLANPNVLRIGQKLFIPE